LPIGHTTAVGTCAAISTTNIASIVLIALTITSTFGNNASIATFASSAILHRTRSTATVSIDCVAIVTFFLPIHHFIPAYRNLTLNLTLNLNNKVLTRVAAHFTGRNPLRATFCDNITIITFFPRGHIDLSITTSCTRAIHITSG
jgi:hypothetical protein